MIVGFTGSRLGLLQAQHDSLRWFLTGLAPTRFVHGDGGHSDALAHAIVEAAFPDCYMDVWPSTLGGGAVTYFGTKGRTEVHKPIPPLERNRIIVALSHGLIACPARDVEDWGSGSWATIRYAREIGVPVYVIRGNGEINAAY